MQEITVETLSPQLAASPLPPCTPQPLFELPVVLQAFTEGPRLGVFPNEASQSHASTLTPGHHPLKGRKRHPKVRGMITGGHRHLIVNGVAHLSGGPHAELVHLAQAKRWPEYGTR